MTNVLLFVIYAIIGLICVSLAVSALRTKGQQARVGTALFWSLLGIIFMVIGNYLPKTRPNYTIGIRLPWTLYDEENWVKTHRLAGKTWLFCGILIFFNAFIQLAVGLVIILTLVVMLGVPVMYSYWLGKSKQR